MPVQNFPEGFVFKNAHERNNLLSVLPPADKRSLIITCAAQGGGMEIVMEDKLIINKKKIKGEDSYKTFSVRIKEETVNKLNKLSEETNRSRNELINILLDYAIDNSKVN